MGDSGSSNPTRKKVLVRSSDKVNLALYTRGLSRHYDVNCERMSDHDAVVLDLPADSGSVAEILTVLELGIPAVVLTPRQHRSLQDSTNLVVLSYPVSVEQLIRALTRLGVEPGPGA